ncbi:hypothetical protein [Paraburkholderia fynbosensis]|uniref:hypothetical protein n=1 Tax=Paraburkholderia fynbosensis TaxID=1200993 RepID=UPI001C2E6E16|nr:hypothetical protein [Paraburkholderia fynbosensis]
MTQQRPVSDNLNNTEAIVEHIDARLDKHGALYLYASQNVRSRRNTRRVSRLSGEYGILPPG